MANVIIDTGFFLAVLSENDQFHRRALVAAAKIAKLRWWTTWPVLTETCHFLGKMKPTAMDGLLRLLESSGFAVFDLKIEHMKRVRPLVEKYRDLPMDLADASLVILAEDLGCGDIVSTDQRDFHVYRFKNHKPFKNLL